MPEQIHITENFFIPWEEISIAHAKSGGPGGQNVNKVNSKVFLRWHLPNNCSLTPEMRYKIEKTATPYLTNRGEILISSTRFRTQHQNLDDCIGKLATLVKQALITEKKRLSSKMPRAEKEKILHNKKKRAQKKKLRTQVRDY